MIKNVGIVGATGRVGRSLVDVLNGSTKYVLGPSFGRRQCEGTFLADSITEVFRDNDCVVDFSSPKLIQEVLKSAMVSPKPLLIGTTGWDRSLCEDLLEPLSKLIPIVIAPNTSIGAAVQLDLARYLVRFLGKGYDIDILEKHHRNKADKPSGTAKQLQEGICQSMQYIGKNDGSHIQMNAIRSGNLCGEHEVSFVSDDDSISIKHVAFNRGVFVKGVLKILDWLSKNRPEAGIYGMHDVLRLSSNFQFNPWIQ